MNFRDHVVRMAHDVLTNQFLEKAASFQSLPMRRDFITFNGSKLFNEYAELVPPACDASKAPGRQFERVHAVYQTLRDLEGVGLFADLLDPPAHRPPGCAVQANSPLRPAQQAHVRALMVRFEEMVAAADQLADVNAPSISAEAREGEVEYVIFSPANFESENGEAGFWSNVDGWVDLGSATRFSEGEVAEYRPPVLEGDAHWLSLGKAEAKVADYNHAERRARP